MKKKDGYNFEQIVQSNYEDVYPLFLKVCKKYNNGRFDDDTMQIIIIQYEKIKDKICNLGDDKNKVGYLFRALCNACYDFKVKYENFSNSPLSQEDKNRLIELGKKLRYGILSKDESIEYDNLRLNNYIKPLEEYHMSYRSKNIDRIDRSDLFKKIFKNLSDYDIQIIKLFYYEKLNDGEVAKELNKSRTTIRDRRKKVLRDLKEMLLDLGIDEDILKEMN